MPEFAPEHFAEWSGGRWTVMPAGAITGVEHDTRSLHPGVLYVALSGERFDGHDFLRSAFESGAVAALCARGRGLPGFACLEVDDPLAALGDIARGYRRSLGGLVVGITGSAGKTTVKDLLAEMLARRGETCKTRGNWNNFIGLPLSILRMESSDVFGVFEAGMNRPGEIAGLCRILEPICGVVTSIGEAHLENFGSVAGIAREKACMLEALPEEGVAVVDIDSPWRDLLLSVTRARVVSCSFQGPADYQAAPHASDPRILSIQDRVRGVAFDVESPLPGVHMQRNLLQAVVVAREFGLTPEEITEGAARFAPAPMRWERQRIGFWTLINDAYNANPLSMRSSIRTFAEMTVPVEKWLVLGGMAELGAGEAEAHRALGGYVSEFGFHGVVTIGPKAAWIAEQARGGQVHAVASVEDAAAVLHAQAGPGAGILLKASRADRLEALIPLLQSHPEEVRPDV